MYILIYGQDTYRSQQHIKKLVAAFKEKRDPQGLNVFFVDCQKDGAEKMWEHLGAVPFLAEKRMVVLRGTLEHYNKEVQGALLEKLEAGAYANTTVIIFVETKSDFKKNNLFKFLQKQAYSQEFPILKEYQREAWLKQEATARNGSITTGAARMISDAVEETWQLSAVLAQALAFAGKKETQRHHVAPFIEPSLDDNIFNFTDALASGNTKRALELLGDQRRAGANEFYLLSMITRQFRILLQLHDYVTDTLPPTPSPRRGPWPHGVKPRCGHVKWRGHHMALRHAALRGALRPQGRGNKENSPSPGGRGLGRGGNKEIEKETSLHPFVIKKSIPLAKRYSLDQLKTIYQNLLKIETILKTTSTPADALFDQFVVTSTSSW